MHEATEMKPSVLLLGSVESGLRISSITEGNVKQRDVKWTVLYRLKLNEKPKRNESIWVSHNFVKKWITSCSLYFSLFITQKSISEIEEFIIERQPDITVNRSIHTNISKEVWKSLKINDKILSQLVRAYISSFFCNFFENLFEIIYIYMPNFKIGKKQP